MTASLRILRIVTRTYRRKLYAQELNAGERTALRITSQQGFSEIIIITYIYRTPCTRGHCGSHIEWVSIMEEMTLNIIALACEERFERRPP